MSNSQTLKSSTKTSAKSTPKKTGASAGKVLKQPATGPVAPKNPGHDHPFPRTEFLTTVARLRDTPGDAVAEGLPVTADFVALKPQTSNNSTSSIVIYDTTVTGASAPVLPLLAPAMFSDAIAGAPDSFVPDEDGGFGTDPL